MKKLLQILLPLFFGLVLTLVVTHVYFQERFPYTHDGENHLARFANYQLALREKQFPPRFAPNLFNHLGYPVFNYNYPLANILSVPFSFADFHYEVTFKLLVFSSVLLGLFGVYLWLSELDFSLQARLFGMGVFAATPFLISTIVFRGNIGEIMALSLFPWLFWIIERCRAQAVWKPWQVLQAITLFTFFFLVHNISTVFGLPLLVLYAALRLQNNFSLYRKLAVYSGVGLLFSLWFWIPALLEKGLTILETANVNTQFVDHFPSFSELILSPLQFGFSQKGAVDGLSSSVGVVQVLLLLVATIILLKQWWASRKLALSKWSAQRQMVAGLVVIGMALLIGQLAVTWPIWQVFFFLTKYLQFPWRLSLFFGVLVIPVAAYAFEFLSKPGRLILAGFVLWQLIGISRVLPVDMFHKNNEDYDFFTQSTSTNNENKPTGFTYQMTGDWQPTPQFLNGKGEVQVGFWRGSQRSYTLTVTEPAVIVEPTMKFAGWQTTITPRSGQKPYVVQYFDNQEVGGRIAYQLNPGIYQVRSQFTQWTLPRIVGNTLSLITAVGLGTWFIHTLVLRYAKQKKK